ncbi:hypothetical protein AAG570_012201 [Ranatra chinensis]|uniref:BMERB domain-containing protein n=1 Tax=Ranatra chinensis TaxID=642074 RepID=A0ABD0YIC1_9HEMI
MRYENELMVRAQELELEDRHSRLQNQLKNLLANDVCAEKTNEDVALEGRILREMLEIVERRNALGSQLEAERQRCQHKTLAPVFIFTCLIYFLAHFLVTYYIIS